MEQFLRQFYKYWIGSKKIINLELSQNKTLLGREVYKITYKDGTEEELPQAVIEQCATKQASDATQLRELRVKPVVNKIMGIFTESDLKLEDVAYTIQKVDASIEEAIKQAITKLWHKEYPERTMSDIDAIIKKNEL